MMTMTVTVARAPADGYDDDDDLYDSAADGDAADNAKDDNVAPWACLMHFALCSMFPMCALHGCPRIVGFTSLASTRAPRLVVL